MKLDKKKKRDDLADRLEALHSELEEAVSAFNAAMTERGGDVTDALKAYNDVLAEARSLVEDTASEARDAFDEKSERWQEGDKGAALSSWADELEGVDLEDMEIDLPEDIELPDGHAETLRDLPERPE